MNEPQLGSYSRRHPIDVQARKIVRLWAVRHPADVIDTELDDAIRELALIVVTCDRENL